jgi:2-polyprenyl-6-methoxyphenol hydroxylase-like FAD-dependent oxidoreductase
MTERSVLICGASIAGPALAFWLRRHGFRPVVVERAPVFRDGGQNIDVRGAARTVLQRMGLKDAVASLGTGEQGFSFVDGDNRVIAMFDKDDFGGNGPTAELEILRGDLARLLYEHGREDVDYRFGDRITEVHDGDDGIQVTLEKGGCQRFDLVLVAEGIGSSTRKLLFGDEVKRRPLDLYMGYFTIPKGQGDGEFCRWFNAPGGRSVCLRPDREGTTRALLTIQQKPVGYERLSLDEQKAMLKERFADAGWETPRVLAGLGSTKDFYFEAIGQVKLDCWSKGRVALTGDAAWCAGPISGMGTSLALVGAYVLAGELSRHEEHTAAFAAYERVMRPYVEHAQDVSKIGPRIAHPRTRFGIALQRAALGLAARPSIRQLMGKLVQPPADDIDLPDYGRAV